MQKFKTWMKLSSSSEKKKLARLAKTSHIYLYAIAAGDRECSSAMAGAIADASRLMYVDSNKRLPLLWRSDLSPVCASCPYSPKCGK